MCGEISDASLILSINVRISNLIKIVDENWRKLTKIIYLFSLFYYVWLSALIFVGYIIQSVGIYTCACIPYAYTHLYTYTMYN